MLIAIDLGYAQVKAKVESNNVKFPSVVGNPSVFRLEDDYSKLDSGLGRMEIVYQGKTYMVGYGALAYTNNARLTLKAEKSDSESNLLKMLAAIAALNAYSQESVEVVTGLPVFQFNQQKQILIDSLKGDYSFTYDGKSIFVKVAQVDVIPQGAGVYYGLVLDDGRIMNPALSSSRCTVVDCGSGNTNIITMEKSKYDSRSSSTLATGVWQIFSELQRLINEKYQVYYKLTQVEMLAKQGYMDLYNQRTGIMDLLKQAVDPIAQEIVEGFHAVTGDHRKLTGGIILAGGGAFLIKDHFTREFGDIVNVINDPEMANVNGFYQYGLLKK